MWLTLLILAASPVASQEVACAEVAFSQSVETQDLESFRSFLHPDTRFIANSVLRGAPAVTDAWGEQFFGEGAARLAWRPEQVEVSADGTLALSRGPYRLTRTDADGQSVTSWGLFQSIWQRSEDGRWTVLFDAGFPEAIEPTDAQRTLFEPDAFAYCSTAGP